MRGTGVARRRAVQIGRLTHRLLQHMPSLPPGARRAAGLRFLERHGGALAPEERAALVDRATAVVGDPRLAPLFGPGSRAEVGIAGELPRPGGHALPVVGQIDRMGVTADAVLIADFKTGSPRALADTPRSYVLQLALYRAVVAPLYPGRTVRALLVWVAGPEIVEIDAAMLDAALVGMEVG